MKLLVLVGNIPQFSSRKGWQLTDENELVHGDVVQQLCIELSELPWETMLNQ